MGWETRRNGRRYYYGKERTEDGRVRSVYLGTGPVSECIAEYAEGRRLEASLRRRELACTFGPIDAALNALRASEARLRLWRDAYLVATGHRSHRGQWRRRRGLTLPPFTLDSHPAERPAPMPKKKTPAPDSEMFVGGTLVETDPDALDGLAEAIGKCRGADPPPGAVEDLRRILLEGPRIAYGLSAKQARQYAARFAAGGDDVAVRTIIETEAASMEADLREETDGPLVRAACRHAADARLILDGVRRGYVSALTGTFYNDSATMWERRQSAAQTRYLRALATVAKLREVEAKERRRADVHGLQMDAARRTLPARGDRRSVYADLPIRAPLPSRSGEAHASPEAEEVTAEP
ncbi:hypothetical protein B1759_14220 [Rubrivirga sp. SAORIC476]|uniref:hypothetical protein n=1 Tax=Rubrivirga sp. SAORIC476 TaxID=1961794 RepID=UPI000BA9AC7B|nr:hypothetical protein [Rubrivirga sp. SAORIC476]PAP79475.1 hypothetical protein B1759_14220 [Rubrivirga sp. SAORIC476]